MNIHRTSMIKYLRIYELRHLSKHIIFDANHTEIYILYKVINKPFENVERNRDIHLNKDNSL